MRRLSFRRKSATLKFALEFPQALRPVKIKIPRLSHYITGVSARAGESTSAAWQVSLDGLWHGSCGEVCAMKLFPLLKGRSPRQEPVPKAKSDWLRIFLSQPPTPRRDEDT